MTSSVTPEPLESPPVGQLEDVGDVTSGNAATNFSSTARAITDFVSEVTSVVWKATTDGRFSDLDRDPDSSGQGQPATSGRSQEEQDSERRQLLIAIICLAVVLGVVLAAIGYFFYRVSQIVKFFKSK